MLDLMVRSGWRHSATVVAAVLAAAATGCGPAARDGTSQRATPPVELLLDPGTPEGNLQAVNPATCAVRDVGLPRFPTPTFQRDHAGYVVFRPMPGGGSIYTRPTGVFIGRLGEGEPEHVWTMGNFVPERMAAWDLEGQRVAMVLATTRDRGGGTAPGGVEQAWDIYTKRSHQDPQTPAATIPMAGLRTDRSEIVRIPVTGGTPALTCAVPRHARLLDWD